jgi:hypothetical protein
METKRENWKRKPHFTGQHGNGHGNENHAGKETKGTKTPSLVSMAGGWQRNLFEPLQKGSLTIWHRFSVSSIKLISAY